MCSLRLKLNNSVGLTVVPPLEGSEPSKILVRDESSSNVQSVPRLSAADRDDPVKRAAFADRLWTLSGTA